MSTFNQMRVLYVDHDQDSCEVLASLLRFYEVAVTCASTVREAVDFARSIPVDLFLLANRFADGDGAGLCRTLRAIRPQTPVAFYTGDAGKADKKAGLLAGAIAYIEKPDFDGIVSLIKRLANRQAARNPLETVSWQGEFDQTPYPA
jgi:two-component system OmpR family response regulator